MKGSVPPLHLTVGFFFRQPPRRQEYPAFLSTGTPLSVLSFPDIVPRPDVVTSNTKRPTHSANAFAPAERSHISLFRSPLVLLTLRAFSHVSGSPAKFSHPAVEASLSPPHSPAGIFSLSNSNFDLYARHVRPLYWGSSRALR